MLRVFTSQIVSRSLLLGLIALASRHYVRPEHLVGGRLGGLQHEISSAIEVISRTLASSHR